MFQRLFTVFSFLLVLPFFVSCITGQEPVKNNGNNNGGFVVVPPPEGLDPGSDLGKDIKGKEQVDWLSTNFNVVSYISNNGGESFTDYQKILYSSGAIDYIRDYKGGFVFSKSDPNFQNYVYRYPWLSGSSPSFRGFGIMVFYNANTYVRIVQKRSTFINYDGSDTFVVANTVYMKDLQNINCIVYVFFSDTGIDDISSATQYTLLPSVNFVN